ncbi:MAG: molybdenum cofactor biosynthesis protein MoaE [Euryarchaeota archaeon]|nr:molybdenum cofactor biosynthesis protein MoaE [Euryarchaeota archaeon]
MGYAKIQHEAFRIDDVLRELRGPRVGGVTFYVGTVRGSNEHGRVEALDYDAYPEMAEAEIERLRSETVARFGLVDATVIHRIGRLEAGEPILLVALAGSHRTETYEAVAFFMDRLKTIVPIWKKEIAEGGPTWILGGARVRP